MGFEEGKGVMEEWKGVMGEEERVGSGESRLSLLDLLLSVGGG
jgi:hypothetical protein